LTWSIPQALQVISVIVSTHDLEHHCSTYTTAKWAGESDAPLGDVLHPQPYLPTRVQGSETFVSMGRVNAEMKTVFVRIRPQAQNS
jgi:hypothetical protein